MSTATRIKALQGAGFVASTELVAYGAAFLRNIILARVLAKSDFGVAAILFLVLGLFELTAKMGVARFVVQDKEGNNPEFVASAHLVLGFAGVAGALLIIASAPVFSHLFNITDKWWALILLALVPIFRGLEHVDIRRYERTLRFGPSSFAEIIPQIIITIAAWPVAVWLGDFTAVLVLLIAKSAISCAISHFYAAYPYKWQWHKDYVIRMWKFGWPLILTSLLMFFTMQGDQFMVATFYDMSELGSYAVAVSLVTAVSFILGRVISSVGLPLLSEVQDQSSVLQQRYRKMLSIGVLLSVATAVPMILGAEALVKLLFGKKYSGTGVIMAWLASAYAFRNLRVAPAIAALARGDSVNQLISNAWRATAIAPMLFAAWFHQPIWVLAACGLVGETGACWASFARLRRRDGVPIRVSMGPTVFLMCMLSMAGFLAWIRTLELSILWGILIAFIGFIGTVIFSIILLPDLKNEVFNIMKVRVSCKRAKILPRAKTQI